MLRWLTLSPMRLFGYILFVVFFCVDVSAQKVNWERTTINFGTVQDWNSPPATFSFTNTGNKRLMFLPQKHERDILVRYPNRAIEPGETAVLEILYYTSETGAFSRTVEVYTNASNKAERLVLKGNIKSIYANALTACPTFHEPAPVRTTEPNVVQVVDAATNRPIPNAQVEVFDRGIRKAINGTNLEGVAVNWIEPDSYTVVASKDGYERAEQEVTFTKRNRTAVVYLNRTNESVEEIPQQIVVMETEPEMVEPQPSRRSNTIPIGNEESVAEEPIDLGINTNDQIEEELPETEVEFNLGISTNEQWNAPEETIEETDMGVALNEQIEEQPEKVEEEPEEEIDLGITTNEMIAEETFEEEPVALAEPSVEEMVESALSEAAPITVDAQPPTEPEPEFSSEKYRPNNVLLLLDVSGSMDDDGKMEKLKASIRRLVMMLREVDVLTLIAYNSTSWEVLPPTPVTDNNAIVALVDSLKPYGYTNGVKGMESAYESLEQQLISGGNNQLIIATDGKFNSSKFSEKEAVQLVKDNSDKGIVLSIIGFGDDREAGRLMKKLANLGGGSFLQVNTNEDPTELLAEEIKLRSQK